MKKIYLQLFCFSIIGFLLVAGCLFCVISGVVTLSIDCFAVDSSDRLYVGTQNEIRVYEDGVLTHTIDPKTSSGYMFTIKDDQIVLAQPSKIYTMNLQGDVLNTQEDKSANMYNQIQYKKRAFVSSNGDEYRIVDLIGRTRIVKNKETTVYQISIFSVVVRYLIVVAVISIFSFPFLIVPRYMKLKAQKKGDGSSV